MLLGRRSKRPLFLLSLVAITVLFLFYSSNPGEWKTQGLQWTQPDDDAPVTSSEGSEEAEDHAKEVVLAKVDPIPLLEQSELMFPWAYTQPQYMTGLVDHPEHLVLFALSSFDTKFFKLGFGTQKAINPSIIPGPLKQKQETWVIVGQLRQGKTQNSPWFAQIVCDAAFRNGSMQCVQEPMMLPIAATKSSQCDDAHAQVAFNVGPHDARVFQGPGSGRPYILYGSNSQFACFGQWMQDFRMLVDWGTPLFDQNDYRFPTELQTPGPRRNLEKNWFIFWDRKEKMYVHFRTLPERTFAEVSLDGTVGRELAFKTRDQDQSCLKTYLPPLLPGDTIDQATNSLMITLCDRFDKSCEVSDDNTYIMSFLQHRSLRNGVHSHESYVYLFQRSAPFKIYGVGKKPIWFNGRRSSHGKVPPPGAEWPANNTSHAQVFTMTSMSWKVQDLTYHGYLDDIMFLGFGVDDEFSAALDVRAGDVLQNIGLCRQEVRMPKPVVPAAA